MRADEKEYIERRIHAEAHVEAFIEILQRRYGLKPEDIPVILDDMRWLRQHRVGASRITWSVALGIVAISVSGVVQAFWEGLKKAMTSG